jgi:protein-disulfide isomerase
MGGVTEQVGPRDQVRDLPPGSMLNISSMPVRGGEEAQVYLIEFSDYECPYCARHSGRVGKELERQLVTPGKVKHVFANLPLPMHKNAVMLATGAICAGKQNRYWEMHGEIFEQQPKAKEQVFALAAGMNLDINAFRNCVESSEPPPEIARDQKTAKELGIKGTPSFALGRWDRIRNVVLLDKLITGSVPTSIFTREVGEILKMNKS